MSKKISNQISLKYHVTNPYAIKISNFEFHQIWQKNFWHRRAPLRIFQKIGKKLKILLLGSKIIKISENIHF